MRKIDLAKQIKTFMYDYDLSDSEKGVRVISSSYLKSILFKIYGDNRIAPPYSIIAGDFNKLNDLNKTYGMAEGDRCIKDSLQIVSEILPDFSMICRNGGDEFLFIIPEDLDDKELKSYINKIHSTLDRNKESLHGLSISLAFGNSRNAFSLEELYKKADKKVDIIKQQNNISSGDYFSSYKTLYNSLRLSDDFTFTNEQLKRIMNLGIESVVDMLKTYERTGQFTIYNYTMPPNYTPEDENIGINFETLNKINNIFIHPELPEESELDGISMRDLIFIAKQLVYDNKAHAFTKDYFLHYLKDNLIYPEYKLSLLNLSGLKLANLLYGHDIVDKYLERTIYKNVIENADTQVPLCNSLFAETADCYKIYLGGGDILYVEHPDSHYRPKPEFYKNNKHKIIDSDDPMSLLTTMLQYSKISSTKPIDKDLIMTGEGDWVSTARTMFKSAKDSFKNDLLLNRHVIDIAKQCLLPDMQAYVTLHPNNYMDSENVSNFLRKECDAIIHHEPSITQSNDDAHHFDVNDFHIDFAYDTSYDEYVSNKSDMDDDFDI